MVPHHGSRASAEAASPLRRPIRIRVRRPRGRPLRALPLVGLALAGGGTATAGSPPVLRRAEPVLAPPWDDAGGERPDLTLDAPDAVSPEPPWHSGGAQGPSPAVPETRNGAVTGTARRDRAARRTGEAAHPAIHGVRRTEAVAPLFPRARPRYIVRAGDTLWDIAGRVLETDDVRRISRYWPRIHRANRNVIGANPDLILPGQRLRLPAE